MNQLLKNFRIPVFYTLVILLIMFGPFLYSHAVSAEKDEKITVLLDWFVNPDHATLFVAKENGYFSDENLQVTLIAPADANDPPKLVAAGQADIAVSYQPQLHMHVDVGIPLTRIGTLIGTPLNTLLTLEGNGIDTISDLKNKKIGFSVGGFEEAILGAMLSHHGLRLSDVTLVNVNFSLSPSLLSGQVDAVIGAYRNFELNQLAIEGYKGKAFFPEEEGVPPYDELILVAKSDSIYEDRFRRFINALEKASQFLINHPEESWNLFLKGRPELDNELNLRAWKDTLPRFSLRPGALDKNRYLRFSKFMEEKNLIKNVVNIDNYAVELISK